MKTARELGAPQLLVFNAGSSSLKFELFQWEGGLRSRRRGGISDIGGPGARLEADGGRPITCGPVAGAAEAAMLALQYLRNGDGNRPALEPDRLFATAHRVVHGGAAFTQPTRVTGSILEQLEELAPLAPQHNPRSLAVMRAVRSAHPAPPMVAAFDTTFFAALPEHVRAYAIPEEWTRDHGIRRYGFHGLAHQSMADQLLAALAGAAASPLRMITLQLGNGCSAAALVDGRPVETSMGLTPLEGLVMATRCGDLDPGAAFHLARRGVSWADIETGLQHRSGLAGLSGAGSGMRELVALANDGHAGAVQALAVFHHRIDKYLGAYAAVLGGVDAIAIGGGIGENAPSIRARICKGVEWLGAKLDPRANECCPLSGGRISADDSAIVVQVTPVAEEPLLARAALEVLGPPGA